MMPTSHLLLFSNVHRLFSFATIFTCVLLFHSLMFHCPDVSHCFHCFYKMYSHEIIKRVSHKMSGLVSESVGFKLNSLTFMLIF